MEFASPRSVIRIGLLAFALVAFAAWGRSVANVREPESSQMRLAKAQPSIDALIERVVTAISVGDRKTLGALRVDETEYVALILPGFVNPGEPIRHIAERKAERIWKHHNTLNVYTLQAMLNTLGGKPYKIKGVEVRRVEEYAWYTVHRDPTISLETEDGNAIELELGSIVERHGRFKFISYRAD